MTAKWPSLVHCLFFTLVIVTGTGCGETFIVSDRVSIDRAPADSSGLQNDSTPTPAPTPTPNPVSLPPVSEDSPQPQPTPDATPTPTPEPTPATPKVCSEMLHRTFALSSYSEYKLYFTDQLRTQSLGQVSAVVGDGYTAVLSCVDYGGTNGVAFLVRVIAPKYVPDTSPGGCSESLHAAFTRLGVTTYAEAKKHFADEVYSVADGKHAAVQSSDGWTTVLNCRRSVGFTLTAVVSPL